MMHRQMRSGCVARDMGAVLAGTMGRGWIMVEVAKAVVIGILTVLIAVIEQENKDN